MSLISLKDTNGMYQRDTYSKAIINKNVNKKDEYLMRRNVLSENQKLKTEVAELAKKYQEIVNEMVHLRNEFVNRADT